MLNFGPATITHGGTNIGKTSGGFSLQINSLSTTPLRNFQNAKKIPISAAGIIRKFETDGAITITNSLDFRDFGVLIFTLTSGGVITLHNAKLFFADSLESGMLVHRPFELQIYALHDSNGKLITIA